jgi:hypothetical protein
MGTVSTRWMVALAATLLCAGCGNGLVSDYCEQRCDCENCNDRELDECEIRYSGNADIADIYDCGEEYDTLLQCRIDHGHCDNDYWTTDNDCDGESQDYDECVDDASSHHLIG